MEFLDEDARPRFIFQSRTPPPPSTNSKNPDQIQLNKPLLILSLSLSSLLLVFSVFYLQTEPFRCLLCWVSLSFLVGPFAPCRLTGGDVRVGEGPILEPLEEEEEERPELSAEKRGPRRRSKHVRSDDTVVAVTVNGSLEKVERRELPGGGPGSDPVAEEVEEREWSEEDIGLLKKQMVKHPAGKPGRWEAISVAFSGRHKVESVIKKAKELGEVKMAGIGDYERFLKNRKPLDARVQEEIGSGAGGAASDGGDGWTSGEDIALLNAMKVFPKEVAMRWEKIAAAVPGKSKAACMKRFSELKKDFRSSKANNS